MEKINTSQNWFSEQIAKIRPDRKTTSQLETYIKHHYHGEKLILDQEQLRQTEKQVILRHYTETTKQPVKMDIVAYQIPYIQKEIPMGKFIIIWENITEEIYTINFTCLENQTPDQDKIHAYMKDILLYLGVSQEDIKNKSPRLLKYISTLCYYSPNNIETDETEKTDEID